MSYTWGYLRIFRLVDSEICGPNFPKIDPQTPRQEPPREEEGKNNQYRGEEGGTGSNQIDFIFDVNQSVGEHSRGQSVE